MTEYHAVTITLICRDKATLDKELSQFYDGLSMQPWDHTVHSMSYEESTVDIDPADYGWDEGDESPEERAERMAVSLFDRGITPMDPDCLREICAVVDTVADRQAVYAALVKVVSAESGPSLSE